VVKVLDFGISKLDAPGEQDTTKTGQMMGSPKYMSPEQMLSMRDVDGRSDIWSLGAILFEFLCGRPPFMADTTPRICALVLNADPPLPHTLRPELPVELERIVLRCLDKEPDRRFADVGALAAALAPFGPSPELVSSGTRPLAAAVTTPATATPSITPPGSTRGATVAAWDTTRYEGPPKAPSRGRRVAAVGAAVALLAVAVALYATRSGDTASVASGGAPRPSASAGPAAAASASATAEPIKPALSPNDLPDVDRPTPTPTAAAHKPAAPGPSAKKPRSKPAVDPFGGRRN